MNPAINPELPLRDIHLPEAVSWWPLAMGWWLLLALVILLVLLIWAARRFRARRQLRQQALAELASIETSFGQHQNRQQLASDLSVLLRRVCVSRFPRTDVAGLSGERWLLFLNSQSDSFDTQTGQALINGPFQKHCDIDSQALVNACYKWIKQLQPGNSHDPV